jgi:hypothetical protein
MKTPNKFYKNNINNNNINLSISNSNINNNNTLNSKVDKTIDVPKIKYNSSILSSETEEELSKNNIYEIK